MFKIGDIVLLVPSLESLEMREGTITRIKGELIYIDNKHKPEDCIYPHFLWPIKAKEQLIKVIATRIHLKKEYDDSMKLVYQLRNDIIDNKI